MPILDHIVISVSDLKKSTKFYSSFLGKPKISKSDVSWTMGKTKLFLTFPYKTKARKFDKHNLGLNHLAFQVLSSSELRKYKSKLDQAKIKNSGIQIDKYGKTEFIWFDDPNGIRLEFYLR